MTPGLIAERLLSVVNRVAPQANGPIDIGPDQELRTIGIDSLKVIDLLLELETEFQLQFPDEMLTADTFRSLGTLRAAVAVILPAQP